MSGFCTKKPRFIKNYLGVSISEGLSGIAIIQKLLSQMGLKLTYVGRLGSRENRERVYQFFEAQDGRDVIYQRWEKRYASGVQQ
jgi:hypothetical protein